MQQSHNIEKALALKQAKMGLQVFHFFSRSIFGRFVLQVSLLISSFSGHGNAAAINSTEISIPAINTTCPYWFTDSKINIITCVVDNDAVSKAGCLNRSTTVQMRVERPENSSFTCSVPQYDNTSRCGPIASLNGWCKCVSYRGKRFTYQLNYFANEAFDEGANVTCQIDCLSPTTPIRQTTFGSCSPIMFYKSRQVRSDDDCGGFCNVGPVVGGCACGGVVFIISFSVYKFNNR